MYRISQMMKLLYYIKEGEDQLESGTRLHRKCCAYDLVTKDYLVRDDDFPNLPEQLLQAVPRLRRPHADYEFGAPEVYVEGYGISPTRVVFEGVLK